MSGSDHTTDFGEGKLLYHLENATVTPTCSNWNQKKFTGCVYDQAGRLVDASQRTKRRVTWTPVDPERIDVADVAEKIQGRCLYLGHYTCHYGHFLLDTLSRFWVMQAGIEYDKIIFQPFFHPSPNRRSFSPAQICFECFGIDRERVLMVDRRLRPEHLYVPTALFEINNMANEAQALIYRQIGDYCETTYGKRGAITRALMTSMLRRRPRPLKLYLSRKQVHGFRPITNEDDVERVFASFGFKVIYPEQLSFEKQVLLYRRADVVAGFEGSAMHNSVFMNKGALAINIGSLRRPDQGNRNQQVCDSFSQVQSAFIRFEGKVVDKERELGAFDLQHLKDQLRYLL